MLIPVFRNILDRLGVEETVGDAEEDARTNHCSKRSFKSLSLNFFDRVSQHGLFYLSDYSLFSLIAHIALYYVLKFCDSGINTGFWFRRLCNSAQNATTSCTPRLTKRVV